VGHGIFHWSDTPPKKKKNSGYSVLIGRTFLWWVLQYCRILSLNHPFLDKIKTESLAFVHNDYTITYSKNVHPSNRVTSRLDYRGHTTDTGPWTSISSPVFGSVRSRAWNRRSKCVPRVIWTWDNLKNSNIRYVQRWIIVVG